MNNHRVRALNYAVRWIDEQPLKWGNTAFPVSYEVAGWKLSLTERRLIATPPTTALSIDEAKRELAEITDGWRANLDVQHRLRVELSFLGADEEPEPGQIVASADFATATMSGQVEAHREAPPAPEWSWKDTETTRLARSMCLQPIREGTRPVADAVNWLHTHLEHWAHGEEAAAKRLNVTNNYIKRVGKWAARAPERKVSDHSRPLTGQERDELQQAAEVLIQRLHLSESNLPPGEVLDLGNWPSG